MSKSPPRRAPGIRISESAGLPTARPAAGLPTACFVGVCDQGPMERPTQVVDWVSFSKHFGGLCAGSVLPQAVQRFFANGGDRLVVVRCEGDGVSVARGLAKVTSPVGLVALPGVHAPEVLAPAIAWVRERGTPLLLLDGPPSRPGEEGIQAIVDHRRSLGDLDCAALYFPWPTDEDTTALPPSGFVAGTFARLDREARGVGSPSGPHATLRGLAGVPHLSATDRARLGAAGINLLVHDGSAASLLGAHTLAADGLGDLRVRRLLDYVQASLRTMLAWTALAPNAPNTWSRVQQQVSSFADVLWQQGELQGTRGQAYWVQCNAGNNTPGAPTLHLDLGLAVKRPGAFIIVEMAWPVAV